jgi:hypothetical protein
MEAYPEKMEAINLEANPEEIQSKSKLQEDPKEEAAVEYFRVLKKLYGDWYQAVGCRP